MLKLSEQKFTASRGDLPETYQDLEVVQEHEGSRRHILFKLNERRWRSAEEAADYLEWAASEIRKLPS